MTTLRPIVLTAGGTGGHVFPAEALAAELISRGFALTLITDKRGKEFGGTLGKLPVHHVSAGGVAGRKLVARVLAMTDLAVGFVQAKMLLRKLRPAAVVGFGGYASLPAMLAATFSSVPTALHEQNAVLGRANRLLAPRVTRIATVFSRVSHLNPEYLKKVLCTGMPVRPAIIAMRNNAYAPPGSNDAIRILIMGGSQGARILSEVVPAALARLSEALKVRLVVEQQCRAEDIEAARAAYATAGINAELASFFHDVPDRLARAHLVISRSGASTVAELTAIGRPSILVPYMYAVDDHQTANARAVAEAGGGWLIPQAGFTPEALAARIESLFAVPEILNKAAAAARAIGVPDAAQRLADLVGAMAQPKEVAA
ncbi:MAG TPA: undecaprenyldiphospho-muramoylpentapeptide beta-N-acetylglucosaminyltransferase [Magnetospirillaceae bacterium]|jgi:UDP-N-acetylglucosamine--N-acetylmuramyl-(pentapeptide) pyrophosphoryl-undecaprenol N-acetylglucosamine transferase